MKKRILSLLITLALITALPVVALPVYASAADESHWGYEMMADLVLKEVLDVMPEDPDEFITREEFCVMLAKAVLRRTGSVLPEAMITAAVFEDADQISEENLPYIMYLYDMKILYGFDIDGKLHMGPERLLIRQEAIAFLGRWLSLDTEKRVLADTLFTDDDEIDDYARSLVYQLTGLTIIEGYPDGSFKPQRNISHAETSTLVYKILEHKILLTYFGDGNFGNMNGSSAEARFAIPSGLCLDSDGSLIIFDTFNAGVKQIKSGMSETILGFTTFIDDYGFAHPYYLDAIQDDALFGRPTDGVIAPNGDLFIADSANNAIRLLRDGMVYTFAGGVQGYANGRYGDAMFDSPSAIAIDSAGNLYIADTMNHAIRRITPEGVVSTIAGGSQQSGYRDGRAAQALFNEPAGIAVGENGVIYVADTGNHVIRKIENGNVTTVAGIYTAPEAGEDYDEGGFVDGLAGDAMFSFPHGLYHVFGGDVGDNILFIADTGNHTIRALTADGRVITVAGSGEPGDADGPPAAAMMNKPTGIVYTGGILYIADSLNNKIKAVSFDLDSLD